jgi:hypothetical protein
MEGEGQYDPSAAKAREESARFARGTDLNGLDRPSNAGCTTEAVDKGYAIPTRRVTIERQVARQMEEIQMLTARRDQLRRLHELMCKFPEVTEMIDLMQQVGVIRR